MQNTEDEMEHSEEENKPQREHISSIYKEYTTPSRVLRSFTNLANTVIQTALSGQSKFVFEILQNADDAYEDPDKSIELKFILQDNYLIVKHDGKGFDFNDVERICDYASQIEEVKATDLRKTGYKGLGFKSLFSLSDCIYIHSNGYTFRFDKGHWPDPESKPWQVIPIWCEYDELPLNQNNPYDQPVNLILKVNDATLLASQLRELVDQPDLLLYLFRINKLSVSLNEEQHFLVRRTEKFGAFNKIDFYKNQQVESTWLSIDYTQPVPTDVQTAIRGASRFIYPDRIINAKEMTFTFALRSNETLNEISNITGICYSTLPTQLDLTLPYHINSLFILNLDRTQLHENEWNEFILEQLGYLQFKLLKDLADMEYLKNYVIQLFVREINHPYEKFNKAFLKGFKVAKGEIGWLPSHHGDRLLKLGEACTDETEFFKQDFQNIQNNEIIPYLINYEVKGQEDLSSTEANHFTYETLFRDFPTIYCRQLTYQSYLSFINYLYERIKDNTNMNKLKSVHFLVAKDGTLLEPVNALLEETPIPNFFLLNPIDNRYLPSNNIVSIKNWLTLLGARRLSTPIQVLRESVFKWIDSGILGKIMNEENHIGILNYLAKGLKEFTHNEKEKLKQNLLILTESKQFKLSSSCYFRNAVWKKELSITADNETVSTSYDVNILRDLFILVGVIDLVNPIDILRKGILVWIGNGTVKERIMVYNYAFVIEFLASTYFKFMYELTENEKLALKKMPVFTCGQIFQLAQGCYFESAVPIIKGLEGLVPNNKMLSTNYSDCVINFLETIGVSRSMTPIDVIRKSILKWIKEGDILNRITLDNHHEIFEYIGKHWSNLELDTSENEELKKIPILTCDQTFQTAQDFYLESAVPKIKGLENFVPSNRMVPTNYSPCVLKFFKKIGVSKSMTSIDVIRESILKWIQEDDTTNQITKDNHQDILKYIGEQWNILSKELHTKEKEEMKKMPILTCDQTFHKAQSCYLESAVPKIKGFEGLVPNNRLVPTNPSDCVTNFLTEIGVCKSMTPTDVIRKSILKWIQEGYIFNQITKDNHHEILEYIGNYWNYLKQELETIEKEEMKKMPILTLDQTFQMAQNCFFESEVPQIKVLESIVPINRMVPTNYSDCAKNFLTEIGVSKSMTPTDVIRKSIIKWIRVGDIFNRITHDNHYDILDYISKHWNNLELDTNEKGELKKMPILTCDQTFQTAQDCFFESDVPKINVLQTVVPINRMAPTNYSDRVMNFLKEIGVSKSMTPIDVIRKSILKWLQEGDICNRITLDNHLEVFEYIGKHWNNLELETNEKEELKKMPILTYDQTFQTAQDCYFDTVVPKVKGLESCIPNNRIVPTNYSTCVLKFLKKIGVSKSITPTDVVRKSILKWIQEGDICNRITLDNYPEILEYIGEHWNNLELETSETEELKKMPILTCDQTFQTAQDCYFESVVPKIKGLESFLPSNRMVPNYSPCALKFLRKIGVSKSMTPIDVIRESILKWIQEDDTTNQITKENHQDILKYIGEQWNILSKELHTKEKEEMKKMPILTCDQTFQNAQDCYLKSAVPKIKGFEGIVPNNRLVPTKPSDCFINFLTEIGVSERMTPIDVIRKSILKWIQEGEIGNRITLDNHLEVFEYIGKHWNNLELETNEKEELKKFPILTCDKTFQKPQDCFFYSVVPKIEVLERVVPINRMVHTYYSDYVINFLTEIGVSKSLTPIDVIRKSILKWIQEDDAANQITKDNQQDILEYIDEQWTIINSPEGLNGNEKEELKNLQILTESGEFRSADKCYYTLSGFEFKEIPGIKSIITSDEFVLLSNYSKIKNILKHIGIHEIRFTDIYERYSNHLNCKENVKWFFFKLVNYFQNNKTDKNQLLNYLQQKFNSSPCLLAKNNEMYSSTEIYSSRFDKICDIDVNTLLVLQYESKHSILYNQSLPDDFEEYIGFKKDLDIKCIKQLLEAIGKKPDLGKDKTKEFFITILKELRKKDKNEVKNSELSLLSLDNKLMLAKNLYYFNEEKVTCSLKSRYLKRIVGMSHEETLELAELCGVNTMPFQQEIIRENKTHDNSLKEFYLERLPYIALQESKELCEDVTSTLKRLYEAISAMELYVCRDIQVKYPFGDFTNVQYHFKGPTLSVVDEWDNKRSIIHDYLYNKLDLKSDIRCILDMRQPKTEKNKEYWLSSENQDPQKFYIVEEWLKQFVSNNGIVQSEICAVEVSQNDEAHQSGHKDINFKHGNEARADVRLLSDEILSNNEIAQNDQAHHSKPEVVKENPTRDNSLNEFYLERLPFIALQESKKLCGEVKVTLKCLYDEICSMALYLCHSLQVKHPFGDNTDVQHHFEGLELYIVGEWCKKKSKIHDYLKEKLGLKTDVRDILDMEQPITQSDKKSWLSSEKQDPQELEAVEELLKRFLSNNGNVQSEILCAVEISQNDVGLPSDECLTDDEIVPNDQAQHSKHEDINFEDNNQELLVVRSPKNRSLTDHVFHRKDIYLKKKNVFKPKSRQVGLTVVEKLRVSKPHDGSTASGTKRRSRQSDRAVEIFQNDQVYHSDYKYRNHKEFIYARSTSNESLTDPVYDEEDSNFQNKNVFKHEGKQVWGTATNNQKFQSRNQKINEHREFLRDSDVGGYITTVDTKLLISSKTETVHYANKPNLQTKNAFKHKSTTFCGTLTDTLKTSVAHEDTFADGMNISAPFEDITESVIGEDNIKFDTILLVPCKLKTSHINRIPQPDIQMEGPHTGSSGFVPEVSDDKSEMKWLSEKYVFTCLQRHYKNKYTNAEYNLSEGIFTLQWQSKKIEIVWLNASGEKGKSYDILLKKEDMVKRLIEVKSTTNIYLKTAPVE